MKVKILRRDIFSYLFLMLLAGACLAIGVRMLIEHRTALGAFGVALGGLILFVPVSMVLRKR
ncbi:MAG: hypothetical protein FWF98_00495 [Dehalococcoidia bacterium]|nr:hypothetical protein [Dehalococcoidia bacterium]